MGRKIEAIRYIQFDPSHILLDPEFEEYRAEARLLYLHLLLMLAASGGRLPFKPAVCLPTDAPVQRRVAEDQGEV